MADQSLYSSYSINPSKDISLTSNNINLSGTTEETAQSDADLEAVQRMMELLFDICEKLAPNFQIILLEHANLPEERFQSALVEDPWTKGRALIPEDWLI